jgi:hypothetical protein
VKSRPPDLAPTSGRAALTEFLDAGHADIIRETIDGSTGE